MTLVSSRAMHRLLRVFLVASLCLACSKKQEIAVTSTTFSTTAQTATTSSAATTSGSIAHSAEDLLGLASGALVVVKSTPADSNGDAWHMFDEDPLTGWTSDTGKFNEPNVVELADRSVIRNVSFDFASVEYDGRIPRQVTLEMSDTSAKEGFQPIADLTIAQEQKDGVTFPVAAQVPGRWLRITVKSLSGTGGYAQIMELRAFGDRLTKTPPPKVTGTYKTADHEDFLYLTQTGTQVTGCYSHGLAPLVGGMEGRLLKYSYQMPDNDSGPAIAIFSNDGSVFEGRWKMTGVAAEHPRLNPTEYRKESDQPGQCPNAKKPEDQLASDLKRNGRVRLYGINFDSDSATIRDESKPALDLVASMLKTNPEFRITIEGHTDSTSTPQHNQELSESRANAVKAYLAGAGVDAARLTAAGFGATKPVASNDSALGRAENRRVELAKS